MDGNGMGWKLLCVVMGCDGMVNFWSWDEMGWESVRAGMRWDGKHLVLGWDGI